MPVLSCDRLRGGSAAYGVPHSNTYRDQYRIKCTGDMARFSVLEGAQQSGAPDKLPRRLDFHTESGVTDSAAVCQNISLEMEQGDKCAWIATCEFGPLKPGQTVADQTTSPLLRPVKWRVEWFEESGIAVKDKDGAPLVNAVGDEFDTPVEKPGLYMVLVGDKAYATVDEIITLGLTYHGSVNSANFRGATPRQVKFLPMTSSEVTNENGVEYFLATFRFAYNPETWDVSLLNHGWRYRPAKDQDPVEAVDPKTRLAVSKPVHLAEDGTLLPEGAKKVYLAKRIFTEKDYNAIFAVPE